MFICLIDFFVLVIIEIYQKIFPKIERCNLCCTGKILQNFDMQKWEKRKKKKEKKKKQKFPKFTRFWRKKNPNHQIVQ